MPGSLPVQPVPVRPAGAEPPVFAPTSLGKLAFNGHDHRAAEGSAASEAPQSAVFDPENPAFVVAGDEEEAPEQQPYVELPQFDRFGEPTPAPAPVQTPTNRYVPLPPSSELIEVLPRMLPNTRGLANIVDGPFSAMPETMPPPPLRPVLPPELQPDGEPKGLVARLFGPK